MSYLVLARKYRPQTFDQVVKQAHVTQTLQNAIAAERVAHAILFAGPRGTGKTTVARILAKAMNCKQGPAADPCNACRSCTEITAGNAVDVFEIDGASNNSVDQIRELRENIKYMPAHSLYKIYIIDEVHMLSIAAFNALLKTLEEPPAHVMFVFATTEPHKIPITILSRCQRHDFRRIDIDSISGHMQQLCLLEKITVAMESLWLIAREAGGSMRDALSLLDQVMACSQGTITHEEVLEILGVVDRKILHDLSDAVLNGKLPDLLDILDEVYDRGHDMKKLYADFLDHCRNLLVVKMGKMVEKLVDLPGHEINLMIEQTSNVSAAHLSQVFDLLFKQEPAVRLAAQPKLAVEMAFIRLFQVKPALPIDHLIEKLDHLRRQICRSEPGGPPQQVTKEVMSDAEQSLPMPQAVAALKNEVAEPAADRADSLEKKWAGILAIVSEKYPALAPNLSNSSIKVLKEQCLEIEVAGSEFNLNMVQRIKNLEILKGVCGEFFGELKQILVSAKGDPSNERQEKKKDMNQIKQQALNHPLVSDTLEIFDGKIVDVKVL